MTNKNIFLLIVSTYFSLSAIIHFSRLAFEWDIKIGNYLIPSWMSAFCILFSIFIVYWVFKIRDEDKVEVEIEAITEEE